MKDRDWKIFEGNPNGRRRDKARVTLGPSRTFLLNEHAHRAIGSPGAVELMFDGNRRLIGMRPCDPHKANAFPLKRASGRLKHRIISAGAFLTHNKLKTDRTMLFVDIDIDPDGTVVLDLAKTIYVTRGSR